MKKRILVLTPRLPYPVIGGDKLRIYNICLYLYKRGHSLTLVSFVENKNEAGIAFTDPAGNIFEKIVPVVLKKHCSYLQALFGIVGRLPIQIRYYFSRRMHKTVRGELKSGQYDTILCHLVRMAQYVINVPIGVHRVLEMTDAISLNYVRSIQLRTWGLFPLIYRFEQPRVLHYEGICLSEFDDTALVSLVDKEYLDNYFGSSYDHKIHIITNGVDESFMRVLSSKYDTNQVIFIGNMRTYQNLDAVMYFIEDIFPILKKLNPDAIFRVIGTDAPSSLMKYNRVPGIEITGRVQSIQKYAHTACASVCPIRIAAGVQNKILESMAMGIPVVTTSTGLEGIPARVGKEMIVADDPAAIAVAVYSLMKDSRLRAKISKNGKNFIRQNYDWGVQLKNYEAIL